MVKVGFDYLVTGRWKGYDYRLFNLNVPRSYKLPTVSDLSILPCSSCSANLSKERHLTITGNLVVCKVLNLKMRARHDVTCRGDEFHVLHLDLPRSRLFRQPALFD